MTNPMGAPSRRPPHRVGDECELDIHEVDQVYAIESDPAAARAAMRQAAGLDGVEIIRER